MCEGKENCSCGCVTNRSLDGLSPHVLRANLSSLPTDTVVQGDTTYLVVPVVMARANIVMNGKLLPASEYHPEDWNGVPVTVGHPTFDGQHVTAGSPETMEKWAVGMIQNARVESGALKAEAYIDIHKADKVSSGLIELLKSNVAMDVSTGYFSKDEKATGEINGRHYNAIATDLLPDHLALLPNEVGACSWEDGCGVRVNKDEGDMPKSNKLTEALATITNYVRNNRGEEVVVNARGDANDSRQIVADLISNDESPFIPDDNYALHEMSYASLVTLRNTYLGEPESDVETNSEAEPAEEEEVKAQADASKPDASATEEGGPSVADDDNKEVKANTSDELKLPETVDELKTLIANSVSDALKDAPKSEGLTDEDRSALARAHQINKDHRASLVAKITANSDITEEAANAMDDDTLEVVANGLRKPTNYGARPMPDVNVTEDDPAVEAMTTNTQLGSLFKKEPANKEAV